MGFSNFVFAIGLGIKRPLVGMETRKNVSVAEDVLLLGIKNPPIGDEMLIIKKFCYNGITHRN